MPLYDCMMLLKSSVPKESILSLVARVGKHVYKRNGVIADIKSFGTVELGYGIRKLDGRHFQGKLMQMTVMTPPSFNNELSYLNKEDRLLRWILVKHRDVTLGREKFDEFEMMRELPRRLYDFDEEKSSDDDDAYEVDQSGTNEAGMNHVSVTGPMF